MHTNDQNIMDEEGALDQLFIGWEFVSVFHKQNYEWFDHVSHNVHKHTSSSYGMASTQIH